MIYERGLLFLANISMLAMRETPEYSYDESCRL